MPILQTALYTTTGFTMKIFLVCLLAGLACVASSPQSYAGASTSPVSAVANAAGSPGQSSAAGAVVQNAAQGSTAAAGAATGQSANVVAQVSGGTGQVSAVGSSRPPLIAPPSIPPPIGIPG
ncbi:uncharacterized protein LOC114358273 [Ostrinia furnacalis]|uniref:uncharacterized protein LOC114358273 n=1 Tax=Ostrinia furnacalis TaxID=93504 RepID=UPI0010400567|nr:uncharacterized protein LOC114358273 [Ostrinia furnacalis]